MKRTPSSELPGNLARILESLATRGQRELAGISDEDLWRAWASAVDAFLDPASAERLAVGPHLTAGSGLSPEGLQAGLEAVLRGVRGPAARELLEQAAHRSGSASGPLTILLAGNLPALAVQPLLPALALRRPVLLKSPTREPAFAPAFAAALAAREPRLADAVAAVTWRGGDRKVEEAVLRASAKVVAYGEQETIDDLRSRCPVPLVAYGPRLSLAAVGAEADLVATAQGLAQDVALFEQQGCLSVHAVYTTGDSGVLAGALRQALKALARRWPPGSATLPQLAAVRQLREAAELRGLTPISREERRNAAELREGTVIVEPEAAFLPSPGLRTVRVHGVEDLAELPRILAPWRGRLQGIALAGREPASLREELEKLGVSRFAPAGELQHPDAAWRNGGLDPLDALG